MAKQKEAKVTEKVISYLRKNYAPSIVTKAAPQMYGGIGGEPDIRMYYKGRIIVFEVKRWDYKPRETFRFPQKFTELQLKYLRDMCLVSCSNFCSAWGLIYFENIGQWVALEAPIRDMKINEFVPVPMSRMLDDIMRPLYLLSDSDGLSPNQLL